MAWPLVVTGMLFGVAMIMLQVRSPCWLPLECTCPCRPSFAIFIGGMLRWAPIGARRRGHNDAQKARVESVGILIASGLIAGEALTGLVVAYFKFKDQAMPEFFHDPSYVFGLAVMALLGIAMILVPFSKAGAGGSCSARGDDVTRKPLFLALAAVFGMWLWQFATVHFNYDGNWTALFSHRTRLAASSVPRIREPVHVSGILGL